MSGKDLPPLHALELVLPGAPYAWPRPRVDMRGGYAHLHPPAEAEAWRSVTQAVYRDAIAKLPNGHGYPAHGPVAVEILAAFPRPQSAPAGATVEWAQRERDDVDNLAKGILDAGLRVLWHDDGFVAKLIVERVLAPRGHPGATLVRVRPLALQGGLFGREGEPPPAWPSSMERLPDVPATIPAFARRALARARRPQARATPRRKSAAERERERDPIAYLTKAAGEE
jgi:Holliday junction resolvase RusA-like endonuclease